MVFVHLILSNACIYFKCVWLTQRHIHSKPSDKFSLNNRSDCLYSGMVCLQWSALITFPSQNHHFIYSCVCVHLFLFTFHFSRVKNAFHHSLFVAHSLARTHIQSGNHTQIQSHAIHTHAQTTVQLKFQIVLRPKNSYSRERYLVRTETWGDWECPSSVCVFFFLFIILCVPSLYCCAVATAVNWR